jgi:hypothetical protein
MTNAEGTFEGTLVELGVRAEELSLAQPAVRAIVVAPELPVLNSLMPDMRVSQRKYFAHEAEQKRRDRLYALSALAKASFPGLRSLTIKDGWLGPQEASVLSSAVWANDLEELVLEGHPLGDVGFVMLTATSFDGLKRLRLAGCDLQKPIISQLKLTTLEITNDDLAGEFFAKVCCPDLTTLVLQSTRLGDEAAIAIASAPLLDRLVELDLRQNAIGPAGGKAIARSKTLAVLRRLDISRNKLGEEGVRTFAKATSLPMLEKLAILENEDGRGEAYVGGDGCMHYPEEWELLSDLKEGWFKERSGLELVKSLAR